MDADNPIFQDPLIWLLDMTCRPMDPATPIQEIESRVIEILSILEDKVRVNPNFKYVHIYESFKEQVLQIWHIIRMERGDAVKVLVSWVIKVSKLLPENMLPKEMQSELTFLAYRTPENLMAIVQCLGVLQELLSRDIKTDTASEIPKKEIRDQLIWIYMGAILTIMKDFQLTFKKSASKYTLLHIQDLFYVSRLIDVCDMLHETELSASLIRDCQSQLVNVYKILLMGPVLKIPMDLILDHLTAILQDLLSITDHQASEIAKKIILNHLRGLIMTLLSHWVHPGLSEMSKTLTKMLLHIQNECLLPQTLKRLASELTEACYMLPESKLREDLQSQLTNLQLTNKENDVIKTLEFFIKILKQLLLQFQEMKNCCKDLEYLDGIIKFLYYLSWNVSNGAPLRWKLKQMLARNIPKTDLINGEFQTEGSKFQKVGSHMFGVCQMLTPNESRCLEDIKSQLKSICRIDPSRGIPNDIIMDHLVAIMQAMIPEVQRLNTAENILKFRIMGYLSGIIEDLLALTENDSTKVDPMNRILKDMLSQVISGMDLHRMDNVSLPPQIYAHMFKMFSLLWKIPQRDQKVIWSWFECLGRLIPTDFLPHVVLAPNNSDGIPKELMSLCVYGFFPASHSHFDGFSGSYRLNSQYIIHDTECPDEYAERIFTGSMPEYLLLPPLKDKKNNVLDVALSPDVDQMIDTGFSKIFRNMSLEIDKSRPVYCRIKHGMDANDLMACIYNLISIGMVDKAKNFFEFTDGPYLNSAQIRADFKYVHNQYEGASSEWVDGHYMQTEHDCPALVMIGKTKSPDENLNTTSSMDILFCIPVQWNKEYRLSFLKRLNSKRWPRKHVKNLDSLLKKRVYAIPKPDPNSETGDLRWRLSFSVIEVELARSLNDIQRRCYRVLKALIKYNINRTLPADTQKFPSYYLKTAMFWFCENLPEDSWTIQNIGIQWLKLLHSIIDSLKNKKLPMYFVPTYNLLDDKDANTVNIWKRHLKNICGNPLESFTNFWSKYEVHDNFFWESGNYHFSWTLDMLYTFIAKFKNDKDVTQLQRHSILATFVQTYLKDYVAQYLLARYSLSEFLVLEKYNQHNSDVFDVKSDEQLIWMQYNNSLNGVFSHFYSDINSHLFAYLAEVTHHMVLKYGEEVPNKDLISKQTAEKFYLVAFYLHVIHGSRQIHLVVPIKYANYLRVEELHEYAIQLIIRVSLLCPKYHSVNFSRVTSKVLDTCLKLPLTFRDYIFYESKLFQYHLLTSCYIEKRVLAEVYIPRVKEACAGKEVLLGFQFILCGQLLEALKTFASIEDSLLFGYQVLSFTIKYEAMLYIIARICSLREV